MICTVSALTLVVHDYDEAIGWFRDRLDFVLLEDTDLGGDKRWVLMAAGSQAGAMRLLLARAVTETQIKAIGNQAGGRVFLFMETDDFAADHARFKARGVAFAEEPRTEPYGRVAVFRDLCGNRWDLVERQQEGCS